MSITPEDYFGRFSSIETPSDEVRANADELLRRVNALLADCGPFGTEPPRVNSGWRPEAYNARILNAAPKSKHITGQAIDIADPEGELDEYLFNNQHLLEKHCLWMENPLATKGWTHLQSVPPRSGNRVFIP